MENRFTDFGGWLMVFVLGAIAFCFIGLVKQCSSIEPVVVTDTLVIRDTIRHDSLVPVREEVVRWKKVYVSGRRDTSTNSTLGLGDSVSAELQPTRPLGDSLLLPITQKVYTDDSTYTAWVSGYEAMLDSIETYRRKEIVTKSVFLTSGKRWHVGVQGGLYVTPKGVQPGIGVGISYRIWEK